MVYMNNTQDTLKAQIEAIAATADAGYRSSAFESIEEHAWERLCNAEENFYENIMDGGYGDVEYESAEFLKIVLWSLVDLADELGLAI